ncbi:MAG: hypothetical protein DRI34_03935 [Deltaproteobacteria bacterium]|nr:MAG: hypothetical protein DRI34_03935 [Deltaproteobacteria bacterium]
MALGTAGGALVALLVLAGAIEPAERMVLDGWQRLLAPGTSPPGDIVVVAIDQASLEKVQQLLGHRYPWPRQLFALMLCYLHRAGARAVLFDLFFEGPSPGSDELDPRHQDEQLARAAGQCGPAVFAYKLRPADSTPPSPLSGKLLARAALAARPWPRLRRFARADPLVEPLLDSGARFGFANARPDRDGVIRKVLLLAGAPAMPATSTRPGGGSEYLLASLALQAATLTGQITIDQRGGSLRGQGRDLGMEADGSAWIAFSRIGREFTTIPAANVLISALQQQQGILPVLSADIFRDRWVLVGVTAAAGYDRTTTPLSKGGNTPGVYVQAAVLDNLLRSGFLNRVGRPLVMLLVVLLGLVVAVLGRLLHNLWWFSLAVLVLLLGWTAASLGAVAAGWLLDPVAGWSVLLLSLVALVTASAQRERRARRRVRSLFQFYLDPAVVRRLLSEQDALELGGEARTCTVLFADLVGFTSLSEQLEPERLVELLNLYLGSMTEVFLQHGGFLDKYIGDAIMVVFGAPLQLERHARAACQATLEGLGRLRRLNDELAARGLPRLSCRVGVNTGRMVVGNVGSRTRGNYTALGDAVNLAARLEGLNRVFGTLVIIGPETRRRLGDDFVVRELADIRVKGKQRPVTIYELLGPADGLLESDRQRLEMFARALRLYGEGRHDAAREAFAAVLEVFPDDGPARAYQQRLSQQQQASLEKDPVWVMHSK